MSKLVVVVIYIVEVVVWTKNHYSDDGHISGNTRIRNGKKRIKTRWNLSWWNGSCKDLIFAVKIVELVAKAEVKVAGVEKK